MTLLLHSHNAASMPRVLVARLDEQAAFPTPAPHSAPRTETTTAAPASVPSSPLEVPPPLSYPPALHEHKLNSFLTLNSVQAGGLRRAVRPTSMASTTPAQPMQRATTASSGTTGRGPTWWPPQRPWWCDRPTSDGSASDCHLEHEMKRHNPYKHAARAQKQNKDWMFDHVQAFRS